MPPVSAVSVPVKLEAENIEQVWSAVKLAKKPRLQVCAAVSSVQMEYLYHKKADAMLVAVVEAVKHCRSLCSKKRFLSLPLAFSLNNVYKCAFEIL